MIDFNAATALAVTAVLLITELAKLIPVQFTSKYPAWVNAILSLIAAIIIVNPVIDFTDIGKTVGTALFIAVVAAIAYNQYTSRLKG